MTSHTLDLTTRAASIRDTLPELGGRSPAGRAIAFTNAYMTLDRRPWLAVSGEIHYARCPRERWGAALAKMKACGIDIVATYVFWIHHEEEEGRFDWSGDRDLRSFVRACGDAGLWAVVRVGPFCHGEVRNGGLPDWLYGQPFRVRSEDKGYLARVRVLYGEIGRQLSGLWFREGGPIVAIQLENELGHAGAPWETTPRPCLEYVPAGFDGARHMKTLKRLALDAGLAPAFFTATAWGGATVLPGETLPLWGGYAYCPWNVTPATPEHAPTREYVFRDFHAAGTRYDVFDPPYDPADYPFACCEIGGGMQCWYGYRFVAQPESVESMAVVKLAGGCNLLGYYMFHGGSNPVGAHGYLNEHVTPRISYDFQAPLGELGQVRESYRRLRRLHTFVRDFGEILAPMATVLPAGAADVDPRDTRTLRYAARARDGSGFLFLSSYQDHAETRDIGGVAFDVELPDLRLRIPRSGDFTLRRATSAIMPIGLTLGGVRVLYSTTQLLARLEIDGTTHVFFFEHQGIRAEYCLEAGTVASVEVPGGRASREPGVVVAWPRAGVGTPMAVESASGPRLVIHTLTEAESLCFARLDLWGRPRVVISEAAARVEGEALVLEVSGSAACEVEALVFPEVTSPLQPRQQDGYSRLEVDLPEAHIELDVRRRSPGDVSVRVPARAFEGLTEIVLEVDYDGDVGSAFIDGRLVADDFSNGAPWEIGLSRLRGRLEGRSLDIHVTPRREETVVVRESGMAMKRELHGKEAASIGSVAARAVRELVIEGPTADGRGQAPRRPPSSGLVQ